MNRSGVRTESAVSKRDILFTTNPVVAISVRVEDRDVPADASGKKIIKAGSPLYSPGFSDGDRSEPCLLAVPPYTAHGVTQHDIVFYPGETVANANLIIFGFIDLDKMEPEAVTLFKAMEEQLKFKVTGLRGGSQKGNI